jgi:hypothetical protein
LPCALLSFCLDHHWRVHLLQHFHHSNRVLSPPDPSSDLSAAARHLHLNVYAVDPDNLVRILRPGLLPSDDISRHANLLLQPLHPSFDRLPQRQLVQTVLSRRPPTLRRNPRRHPLRPRTKEDANTEVKGGYKSDIECEQRVVDGYVVG